MLMNEIRLNDIHPGAAEALNLLLKGGTTKPVPLPAPNVHPSIDFLQCFFHDAQWPLVAIHPDGRPTTAATFTQKPRREGAAKEWVERHNRGGYNVYFAINPLKAALVKKAAKSDVASASWMFVDIDPPKPMTGEALDAWRADRMMELKGALPGNLPDPTWTIDSGRGFWHLWELTTPQPVDGNGPLTAAIEAHGKAIEALFPWADSVSDICRIARLPGTVNHKPWGGLRLLRLRDYDCSNYLILLINQRGNMPQKACDWPATACD